MKHSEKLVGKKDATCTEDGPAASDEGGRLAQTGDASLLGVAATGVAGALAAAAGVVTRRRRK